MDKLKVAVVGAGILGSRHARVFHEQAETELVAVVDHNPGRVDVAERYGGQTKWSLTALMRYTLTNLVSFSSLPLKLVAYVGFATVAVGSLLLLQTLWKFFSGTAAIGFTTVIAVQVLIGGMIIFSIGVVSIYLAYMYDEQKQRPVFIAKRASRRLNVEGPADRPPLQGQDNAASHVNRAYATRVNP